MSYFHFEDMELDFFPLISIIPELLVQIFSFLSAKDLLNVMQTNSFFNQICKSNTNFLWKKIAERKWDFYSDRNDINWFKYYYERDALLKEGSFSWEYVEVVGDKPSCRMCHTGVSNIEGNQIFYIGGQHGQTNRFDGVYCFDSNTNRFQSYQFDGNHKPPKFARHVTVNIGNKMYTFGGYDGVGTYFGLSVFDPEKWTWIYPKTYGKTPVLRTNHAACAIGTKMYIYGGNRTEEDKTYNIYGDLLVFDTETMTWSEPKTTGEVPGPRVAHKLLSIGKNIYLFGGGVWTPEKDWIMKTPYIHVLNTETMHWSFPKVKDGHNLRVSSFPIPFVCSFFIFVFGGQSNMGGGEVKDLVSFDTISYTWVRHTAENNDHSQNPGARSVGTACLAGGHVYLFGGSGKFSLTDATHKLSHPIFTLNASK